MISVGGRNTLVDMIELDMVDFDIIRGMDCLHSCYDSLDCRTRGVIFQFPNKPVIIWKGGSLVPKGRFISYLKAQKLISKWCLYHLVRVRDSNSEVLSLESISVVNEFTEVFFDDLSGVSLDRKLILGLTLFWTLVQFLSFLIECDTRQIRESTKHTLNSPQIQEKP